MTGEQLRRLRERHDVSEEELSAAMGLAQHVNLAEMEGGSRRITPAAEARIRQGLRHIWKVRQLAKVAAKELSREISRIAAL